MEETEEGAPQEGENPAEAAEEESKEEPPSDEANEDADS
jgi:hypothetical protein